MTLTQRLLDIIRFVCAYRAVTCAMVLEYCLPGCDARIARKLLGKLLFEGLVNKTQMQVVNPANGSSAPVYFPSRKGCETLAVELGDDSWYTVCTLTPTWQHLPHWIELAKFHVTLDKAIALQADAKVERFLTEWDIANTNETEPAKRFSLFTEIRREPRLVCNPDAGWLLSYRGYKKVYYLELSRGTSGIQQIAASKTPGFAALATAGLHRRHFPASNVPVPSVLAIEPTPNRRDALRRAIASKDGARLWKFAAQTDITPEALLYSPILYDCENGPFPLLKRDEEGRL